MSYCWIIPPTGAPYKRGLHPVMHSELLRRGYRSFPMTLTRADGSTERATIYSSHPLSISDGLAASSEIWGADVRGVIAVVEASVRTSAAPHREAESFDK